MSGVSYEGIQSYSSAAKLSDDVRRQAWQAGRDRRAAKTAERAAKVDSGTLVNREKGLTIQDSAKSIQNLNEQQKAGVAAAKVLAEAGLHIEVYASTESERQNGAPNGIYRGSDGTIHIDLNAGDNGQGTVAYALAHETTHFIKDLSPAKYQIYADILIEAAESKGISYDSLLARQLAKQAALEENRGKSAEELQQLAYDETIAEMSETMLTDTDAAQRVSQELYKKDRTLWEKIKDFFTGLVEKLRNAYKGVDPDSDIGRVMKRAISDNEKVAQAWAEAVVEAGENYQLQDGQKNNARAGERFSIRNTQNMSWEDQIRGALYGEKTIRRNDTLVAGTVADFLVNDGVTQRPLAIPLSVLTKASSGKDISHSIKKGKLAKLDSGIKNAPLVIVNPGRNAIVYVTDIKQGGAPLLAAFNMNTEFDGDDVHKATSIHLQIDVQSMLDNLPADATIYVQNKNELAAVGATNNLRGLAANVKFISDGIVAQDGANVNGENVRKSSRNVRDAEYMEFAKDPDGNSFELEDMVREAAESNGFRYRRQTSRKYAPQNDVQYQMFAEGLDRELGNYGEYAYYATDSGAIKVEDILPKLRDLSEEFYGETASDEELNPPDIVDTAGVWDDPEFVQYMWDNYFEDEFYRTDKVPAVVTEDGMIVLGRDDTRVKSGSSVEYDDDGNVIPLSQRFDTANEDIRYSSRNNQESQVDRLARKNEELKAEAEYLRQVVQIQKRGNTRNLRDRESVNAIAKSILESVNAKDTEFGKRLNDFYRDMVTVEMDYDTMRERAGELADRALEHHQAERDGYAQEVLDFLKKRRVSLTESQIGDAEYTYGSLNEFKKAIKGSIIIDQNSTTSLDQLWQEAAAQFPDRFSADTVAADMR